MWIERFSIPKGSALNGKNWEQILLGEVPILKRDAVKENHCLFQ